MAGLKKAGSNWVDGDRFFDRDGELGVLGARVENGTHTLLTAQRRMGKTSLIRELLRRLRAEGRFETVFVNLEDARTAADAVVEIGSSHDTCMARGTESGPGSPTSSAGSRIESMSWPSPRCA